MYESKNVDLPRLGNPRVRIWREVHEAYREVAMELGISTSDLICIVLTYAPTISPYTVAVGLEENYDLDGKTALSIVEKLRGKLIENLGIALGENALLTGRGRRRKYAKMRPSKPGRRKRTNNNEEKEVKGDG